MMSQQTRPQSRRFRPKEASAYLLERHGIKQSPQTLARKRSEGGGPKFSRWNRFINYTEEHLDEYAVSGMSEPLASTSDRGAVPAAA